MHQVNLRTFDLNLLLVFETLMRERHVGRAGEALGLSQPAVSHALGRLRRLLDDPLFTRQAGGVSPTPRAVALAVPIADALAGLRAALNAPMAFEPAAARRTLVIGASDYVDLTLMPSLMAVLRREAPGIEVRRRPANRETVVADLRRREVDLAIGPLAAAPEEIAATPLYSERFVLIARRGHPILAGALTPERLSALDHLLVSPGGDASGSVDEMLRERGLTRRVAMTVPHFLAAPFIVAATDLVAVMAERVARTLADAAAIAIHPDPIPAPPWTIGLGRLAAAPPDPAVDWLAGRAQAVAKRL